jgi:hypothetical protein
MSNTLVWFSASDIAAGSRWSVLLNEELGTTDYGVIVVTRESMSSPWLSFEAGAIGKSITQGRVCPYLVDVEIAELRGPLSQFQAKVADEAGTWDLVQSINVFNPDDPLSEGQLRSYFDAFWPRLGQSIEQVRLEHQALPDDIRARLLEILPPSFYRIEEIEAVVLFAGVSPWEINFNQAATHVWREAVRVAAAQRRLGNLVAMAVEQKPAVGVPLADVLGRLGPWTTLRTTPSDEHPGRAG